MNQQNTAKNKQSTSWQYEFDKRQERKQSKLMRELKRNRKMQWVEGV